MSNTKVYIILAVIALMSIALRVEHYREMKANNPIFNYPIIDSKEYVATANHLYKKSWLGGKEPYYHPPLYPYFIAAVSSVSGGKAYHVKWVQIALDTLNVILIFLVGSMVFGRAIALLSSGGYGLYLPAVQYSSELLPPILLIFLFLLGLYLILKYGESGNTDRKGMIWAASAGIVFGLLVLTLPNFLICVVIIVVWMMVYGPGTTRRKAESAALFGAFVLFFVLLTTARNYYVSKDPILISTNASINLYIGNNEDINRTVSIRPGRQWERFTQYPYETERITNDREENWFWYKQTFKYIFSHPFDWLLLTLKKTVLFFNSYEYPRNFDNAFFAEFTRLSRMPFVNLRIIMPLGLCGMIFALFRIREKRNADYIRLLLLVFAGYAASIILVFIAGRYRLPVIPILILFAAYTIVSIVQDIRAKNHTMNAVRLAAIGILVLLTLPKFFEKSYPYTIPRSESYAQIATTLQGYGKKRDAWMYYQKALKEPVDLYTDDLYVSLAYFYIEANAIEKAVEYFKKAYELNPKNHYALNNIGYNYQRNGEYAKAIPFYKAATNAAPYHDIAYTYLSQCYLLLKQEEEILKVLVSFYARCPSPHPTINYDLGLFYKEIRKDCKKAIFYFRESLRYPQGLPPVKDIYDKMHECEKNQNADARAGSLRTSTQSGFPVIK
ncbi:MAG: glycosyltransferase family 39 protein [Spirochaetes bacterium]|nr:glycosyltransferase family 39 protein [Spirochaetota bacterium]